MSGFVARAAAVADSAAAAALHRTAWCAGYAGIIPDEVLDRLDVPRWAERKREEYGSPRPGAVHLLAVDAATGDLIGLADAGPYRRDGDRDRPDPAADEVYGLYVHPGHWGRGVGRALLTATLDALPAGAGRPVRLWVLAGNSRARTFYERCGFSADGAVATISYDGTMSFTGDGDLPELRYTLLR